MFPCKYSTSGCTVTMVHIEKPDHEDVCEFRPYSCPCPGVSCKWQGSLEEVMPHLVMSHKSITTLQGKQLTKNLTELCRHYMLLEKHSTILSHFDILPWQRPNIVGNASFISKVASEIHTPLSIVLGEDIVFLATDINLPGAVDWVMMQSCYGHHFMLVLEKQEKYDGHQQFFAIAQLIGSRKQAENFSYK